MFDKWLLFFYSKKNSINSKIVNKNWLDNGQMEISGNEPKEWSIIIKPEISTNIYTHIYQFKNKKRDSVQLMKEGLLLKNRKIFDNAIKSYEDSDKEIKKIEKIFEENNSKIEDINDEIFEIKKDLYHENDKLKIKKLNEKLESVISKKINVKNNIKNDNENYILSNKALIKKGPVPTPPTIKTHTYKIIRKKFEFNKSTNNSDISSLSNTELSNNNKTVNEKAAEIDNILNIPTQVAGFIKVIKL